MKRMDQSSPKLPMLGIDIELGTGALDALWVVNSRKVVDAAGGEESGWRGRHAGTGETRDSSIEM